MVAIVAGNGLGLERGSASVLGARGLLGDAGVGRLGGSVTVNGATGNLVIQGVDEILVGQGPDSVFSRSYNSLGLANDDNQDNWRASSQRTVTGLTGTVNTAGSTVTLTDWDGSNIVFTWDAGRAAYVSKEGAGAYDTLTLAASVWTWTDGNSRQVETFDSTNGGRITASRDADGNQLSFSYTGTQLTRVTTQGGDYTTLSWTGSNLTQLASYKADGTLLGGRVRYGYDASNRLTTVTVDLSPGDNSIADGKTAVTTYTYDGTSKRVASISETGSGSVAAFTYDTFGRVLTVTETGSDGGTRVTTLAYLSGTTTQVTDALGKTTTLTFDATSRNLLSITYPPAVSGGVAQVVSYGYKG